MDAAIRINVWFSWHNDLTTRYPSAQLIDSFCSYNHQTDACMVIATPNFYTTPRFSRANPLTGPHSRLEPTHHSARGRLARSETQKGRRYVSAMGYIVVWLPLRSTKGGNGTNLRAYARGACFGPACWYLPRSSACCGGSSCITPGFSVTSFMCRKVYRRLPETSGTADMGGGVSFATECLMRVSDVGKD
jgi:hypothetical protein